MTTSRLLVGGIGNVFLGDDGFGVEVVRRLAPRVSRQDVAVVDFGIRGIDLTYALLEHERVILVDATPRGRAPGTLYVVAPDVAMLEDAFGVEPHSLVPERALAAARTMGARFTFLRLVGCEPARLPDDEDVVVGLSAQVAAAVDGAVELVEELVEAGDA